MATPNEKLDASLAQLQMLQGRGRRVFRSGELTRVHRERLVRNGFLRKVMKGWLISCGPEADPSDTTPWIASAWEFCAAYCTARFGPDWHVSPKQSLLLHAENTFTSQEIIICTPRGANNGVRLPFGARLFDLGTNGMPPDSDLAIRDGLRLLVPEAALVRVPESFYCEYPVEARVALSGIRDASEVLGRLLDGGHSVIAGRLAGAFRRTGRGGLADEILGTMKRAGYDVREVDPFEPEQALGALSRAQPPIVGRLQSL